METAARNGRGLSGNKGDIPATPAEWLASVQFQPLKKPALTPSEVDIARAHIMDRFDRYFGAIAEKQRLSESDDGSWDEDKIDSDLRTKYRIPDGAARFLETEGCIPVRREVAALVAKWLKQRETGEEGSRLHTLLTDIECCPWDWEWILFDRPSQDLEEGESEKLCRLLYIDRCLTDGTYFIAEIFPYGMQPQEIFKRSISSV